ncbi:MAG: AAA family ATPase [Planctomycetota bacterium]|nr:AAA family ATPase [Planctomycetota bacterium]
MPETQKPIDDFLDDLWTGLTPARRISEDAASPKTAKHGEAVSTVGQATVTTVVAPPITPAAKVPSELKATLAVPALKSVETPPAEEFVPRPPQELRDAGISSDEVSRLLLKLLGARGAMTGRGIARHIKLPFRLVEANLNEVRKEQSISLKGEAIAGDYTYVITEKGLKRANELSRECTYFGAAPVSLKQYVNGISKQSAVGIPVRVENLKRAFSDLLLDPMLLQKLGPAINSGRGLFLFGEPGNGKTSIAERISRAFGSTMWIPRALGIDGQLIRVFDPAIHMVVPDGAKGVTEHDPTDVDQRWVRIYRPTVIAGGELTMSELEVSQDLTTKICEAPLQLKSNGGVLLIDDFGRQRMPVDELLNRWIVPLEKRYDLLNLPNGKKVQVPFDQLVIFSTNLEPRDLVDDAFLRRIPYKIEVPNPSPKMFHQLFQIMCQQIGIEYRAEAINYLMQEHYMKVDRSLKACHPRDLLLQIRNFCVYHERPMALTKDSIDFAVSCYFSVLS